MATTACPACGLTVPYFCCEGLVCPACGYDEEQPPAVAHEAEEGVTPQHSPGQSGRSDPGQAQSPMQ
jgi:uncharacterized Zn finger protein (UPF0148 family)